MFWIQSLKPEPSNVTLAQMFKSEKEFEELLLEEEEPEALLEVDIYKRRKKSFGWTGNP